MHLRVDQPHPRVNQPLLMVRSPQRIVPVQQGQQIPTLAPCAPRDPNLPAVTCGDCGSAACVPADHQGVAPEADGEPGVFGEPPDPRVAAGLPALPHPLPAHDLLLHHVEPHHHHHPAHPDPELQAGPGHLAVTLLLGGGLHVRQRGPEPHPLQHVPVQERMEENFPGHLLPRQGSHVYRHVSQEK